MILIKKSMLLSAVMVIVLVVFLAIIVPTSVTALSPKPKFTIVVDAGHGGIDGGVVGKTTGVHERELNLSVAEKLEDYFISSGFGVVMTRKTQKGLYDESLTRNFKRDDMEKRAQVIQQSNANIVISIHMNFYSSSARRGSQVFFNRRNDASINLGKSVQSVLNDAINLKHSGREYSALNGDYYILQCSQTPSIIVECGFLSNPIDEQLLIDEKFQLELAYHIFSGAVSYLLTEQG
ncbi:MAG: N-acetylmuramoyl-L-alanine amidase [Clostridia bacterium]|nr:N-acetylmuramoyl-L-alanine amidase [Clostridia bacterium]